MRVAIVDDTPADAAQLTSYLERLSAEAALEIHNTCFPSGKAFLNNYSGQFDLILMDIDMPGLNGLDTARLLRRTDPDVLLMFVTNMPQYALSAYGVDAMDYLVKPVSYGDMGLKLQKAFRYIRRDREPRFPLHTTTGTLHITPREILYVESSLHYLVYHTLSGSCRVRGSLGEAEALLGPYSFARCSRSFLVNLRYVKAIEKEDVVVGTQRLKISRSRYADFMQRVTLFLGGLEP